MLSICSLWSIVQQPLWWMTYNLDSTVHRYMHSLANIPNFSAGLFPLSLSGKLKDEPNRAGSGEGGYC